MHNFEADINSLNKRKYHDLGVTVDEVWIGEFDLLITYTHHLELKVITALSLFSTLHESRSTR
jgi:hypothetical protein